MKIFNKARLSTTTNLVLGVLMATFVFTAAANAAPTFVGKIVLPHEVHWNHAVVPAGEYSIRMDSGELPIALRSTRTGKSFYTSVPTLAEAKKGAARLNISSSGNDWRVRSMNLPQIGQTLVFEPLTETEEEMFAKAGQIETVPVITARK